MHKMTKQEQRQTTAWNIATVIFMGFMIFPFFLVILNSFKSMGEIGKNIMAWPSVFLIDNYTYAFKRMNFIQALSNTTVITLLGNIGLIVFATMTGYWLIRKPTKLNRLFYFLFLGAMAIPFQATMIPFVKIMKVLGMSGNILGVSFAYWGMCCSTVIFLTSGAIKSIPYDIEEAAFIDGCSALGIYFKVIFPNLRTMVVTFTILNIFYMWNDYLLPFLMLGVNKKLYTIQIALKVFSGEYGVRWDYMLPGVIFAMIVPLILFVVCQKMVVEGMVSGSVKG
jgi:raffinose/stachyose/melibiose transport system permease protein